MNAWVVEREEQDTAFQKTHLAVPVRVSPTSSLYTPRLYRA